MSYGKYGAKRGLLGNTPGNLDNIAVQAWNDPMFALGNLLASAYNKNYDDRGIKKGTEFALNNLDKEATPEEKMAALDSYTKRIEADGYNTLGTYDLDMVNKIGARLSQDSAQNRAAYNARTLNDPANFQDGSLYSKFARGDMANKDAQVGALKQIGQVPMNQGELVQGALQSAPLAQQAAQQRLSEFDADKSLERIKLELIKQGRPQHQIDAIMANVSPQAQSMQKDAYAQKSQLIQSAIMNMKPDSPEYQRQIAELAKYNPEAASLFARNIVTGQQQWQADKAKENAERQFVFGQTAADNSLKRSVEAGKINSNLALENNAKLSEQRFNIAKQYGLTDEDAKAYALGVVGTNKGKGVTSLPSNKGISNQELSAAKAWIAMEKDWPDNPANNGIAFPFTAEADAARKVLGNAVGYNPGVNNTDKTPLNGFIGKYNDLRSKNSWDSATVNQTLMQDKELIGYLKNNPNMIPLFEQQTGIILPRKNK